MITGRFSRRETVKFLAPIWAIHPEIIRDEFVSYHEIVRELEKTE
jgi:hypothetical protein